MDCILKLSVNEFDHISDYKYMQDFVLSAVMLKILFLRYVTLLRWASNFHRFKGLYCLHFHDQTILKTKAPQSFETSGTTHLMTERHIPENVNLFTYTLLNTHQLHRLLSFGGAEHNPCTKGIGIERTILKVSYKSFFIINCQRQYIGELFII